MQTDASPRLSLYKFAGCPWCERVLAAVDHLGIELELRDIRRETAHGDALQSAVGRKRVPVLRIDDGEGTRWLPESADIVAYLYREFGADRTPAFLASNRPQALGLWLGLPLVALGFFAPDGYRGWCFFLGGMIWLLGNRAPLLRGALRRLRPARAVDSAH
ncbi:MAG: glutathione S-transferase N-terminal domain-containing protein [Pseudomonadota bacterium]